MEQTNQTTSRRDFLRRLGVVGSLVIAIGFFIERMIRYLLPAKRLKTYHNYLVAKEGEIPTGSAKEITLSGKPVFVVHLESGYKVFSGICTHLGCIVRWEKQNQRFYCPCHQGIFNKAGEVTGGPPPRPLDEYEVVIDRQLVFIKVEDKTEGPWT